MLDFPASPAVDALANGFKFESWNNTTVWRKHKATILYSGSLAAGQGGTNNFNLPAQYRSFELRIDGLGFGVAAQPYLHADVPSQPGTSQNQSTHRWQAFYTTMATGGAVMSASQSSVADNQRGMLIGASTQILQADTSVSAIVNIDPGGWDGVTYGSLNLISGQVWSGTQTFMLLSGERMSAERWSYILVAGLTAAYANTPITRGNAVLIGYE